MTILHAALAALLVATPVRAQIEGDVQEAARAKPASALTEKDLRRVADTLSSLSDQDYRDAVAADADLSAKPWAKLDRPVVLRQTYLRLRHIRLEAAYAFAAPADRSTDDDAAAASPDAELLTKTGYWSSLANSLSQSAITAPSQPRNFAAVAAVRGGRKLANADDKEVARLLAAVDQGDTDASAGTPAQRAKNDLAAAAAYKTIADIAGKSSDPEAGVRLAADTITRMSDEDYRQFMSDAGDARWAKLERPQMLSTIYKSLADTRFRKAAATQASAEVEADAQDPALLQNSDWWGSYVAFVNQNQTPRRRVAAVAAVRGGRKLSTADDKEVSGLLASVDTGRLSDVEAGRAYARIAAIVGKSAPAAAPARPAQTLSAKEIYERDAKSVVLILAGRPSGQGELGTGSVIDSSGRILTNAHVVIDDQTGQPYPTIHVYLKPQHITGDPKLDMVDGLDAKVSRYDRALDLALLELSRAPSVPVLALGDDVGIEPGDPVVAIGHPEQGGLWTLTQGVVSTVVANLGGVKGKNAFQTDASINRGNSGGPLIDRTGSIIGINTSMARKAADGLTITSVNFSIKSSVARAWIGGTNLPAADAAQDSPAPADVPAEVADKAPAAPVAPVAALPPAPKTKPVVLTPAKPYRIDDVIEADMKEMEDLGNEMHQEIQRRAATMPH